MPTPRKDGSYDWGVNEFVSHVLKDGTPAWIRFPEDYKALADEWAREVEEQAREECSEYRVEDQDFLASDRRTNAMPAASFMRKLRDEAGLKCFSHDSQLGNGSASLFVWARGRWTPICSIQVPLMWEWSALRVDERTGLPSGFKDIGWRSAVLWLVKKGVLSESRAHEIFGRPTDGAASRLYRRALYRHRNQRNEETEQCQTTTQ